MAKQKNSFPYHQYRFSFLIFKKIIEVNTDKLYTSIYLNRRKQHNLVIFLFINAAELSKYLK